MAKSSPASVVAADSSRSRSAWTFLTNHGHVLVFLYRNPGARVRDVAEAVGITERAAHNILAELEADGYVTRSKIGRRNQYVIHPEQTFRHPAEATRPVGELLHIFDPRGRAR